MQEKRILHVAVSMSPSQGVVEQMELESEAARDLEIPWDVLLVTPSERKSPVIQRVSVTGPRPWKYRTLRSSFYRMLDTIQSKYDLILLRYSVCDVLQARFVRNSDKTWLVHHTLELPELRSIGPVRGRILSACERLVGDVSIRHSQGLVCVTKEIAAAEFARLAPRDSAKAYCIYPNGTTLEASKARDLRKDVIRYLFVAGALPRWHGVDLLVQEIERGPTGTEVHFVGPFSSSDIPGTEQRSRFIFHGRLDARGIAEVASKCDVSVSCLALHRKGMSEACPLKARQSLALGLPVFGTYVDAGLPANFQYYHNGPVQELHTFACKMRQHSRADVYEASKRYIEKKVLLKNLYEHLCGI